MNSPFKETGVLYSKEQTDQFFIQSPLLDPEDINEAESNDEWEAGDVEQQNLQYSQDLGWELYRYEINDLLIRTTGQPGQSLFGSSFQLAVAAWKRINGFQFDGILDKETWSRMATLLHIPALVFSTKELYANMGLASAGLPFDAFRIACNGFRKLDKDLKLAKQRILSIADFTQTSDKKRLYILDLADQKILIQTKVAHGAGSIKRGDHYSKASLFSNTDGSHQSSLGFYITGKPFTMRDHVDKKGVRHARGYALWIDGQEKGFNSNARARSIVIHQAEYVQDAPGKPAGYSWGCPAVSGTMYVKVIDTIKDGSCFFIYYNDPDYLSKSLLAKDLGAATPFVQESFNEPAAFRSEKEEYKNEAYPDYEELNETGEVIQHQAPPTLPGTTAYINVSALTDKKYCTGIYIPATFKPSKKIDLVIYLHGIYGNGNRPDGIDYYWKFYSHIREYFAASGRNAILMAPTLGGNPETSNFVFKHPNGFDNFVTACFNQLTTKKYIDADAQPFRIILAAHSAGGFPLRMILANSSTLRNNITEVWGFDCFYNYGWPAVLTKNPSITFYHYYAFKKDGSISTPGIIAGKLVKDHPNLHNIAPAKKTYHQAVIEYAWTNEVNARTWFKGSSAPDQESYAFHDQEDDFYEQDEGANRDYEGTSAYEWEEGSFETDEALQQEDESYTPVTSMLFTATHDLTAEEAASQTGSEGWITKITDKVSRLSFWLKKGPAILFNLVSLFQKGQREPVQLTTRIFNDVLHPERKGKPVDATEADLQNEWNELYNFVVGPYLLSAGYAIKTLQGNVLIPGTPQPTLLKPNEYGLVQFTGVAGKHGDNWMNPTTAVDFYNLIHEFHTSHSPHKDHSHIGRAAAMQHFYELENENVGPDYEEEDSNNFSNYEEPATGLEEVLFEGLVPAVSIADLKTRLDDYLNKANASYTLDTGSTINCFPQFRLATTHIIAPEDAKEKVKKQLRKTKAGAKFAADNSLAIHFSAYGRATPGEIKKITQALIDSGALAGVRTANPGSTDRQLVREMQRSFGVGTDCAGYVQMAFIFAYTGNDSDSKAKRLKLGLKASRGDENLGSLSSVHFKKFNILDAQTGDLLILHAKPTATDRMGHTVIIADHKKTGTKHEFLVDASWGVDTYGIDAGGIARHSFFFDSATGNWSDKHPLTGAIVHINSTGPYDGHIIAGVFRPKT